MYATLTSKGQVTLPKEIRDRLGLDAGSTLDFQLQPDNTITVRAVKPDARRIRGLLKSPHAEPLSVEQMDQGIARHMKDQQGAASASRKPTRAAR
jgi:antitoxin PrlF